MTNTITAERAPQRLVALDLFAGTGWGVACQWLGIEEHGVEIMPEAVASREAAGMDTAYRDVWDGLLDHSGEFKIDYNLLIASPPCQTFSVAGKGAGRKALDDVLVAIERGDYTSPEMLKELTAQLDDRTALVLTPLAHVYRDRPTYVVLEQVPTVLPVWNAYSVVMRELGYSVVTGVLNAEQYGVPQTRKRAILIGRLDGIEAAMPQPTHSKYYSRDPQKLDENVLPWVSMAAALGWGMIRRPYPTVASGTENGGTAPAALGGSGARRTVYNERQSGAWVASGDADNDGGILRLTDQDAAVLQSYPPFKAIKNMGRGMVERYGERPGRASTEPAFTLRASAGGTEPGGFVLELADGETRKLTPEEAATLQSYPRWPQQDRPATTIAGDPRVALRKHHSKESPQMQGAYVCSVSEAATLQTYAAGFPFQGSRGKRFLQIGNAVPPLLARAILEQLLPATTTDDLELAA